jgi:hypothetical protein
MRELLTGKDLGLSAIKGKPLNVKEIAAFLRVSERWVQKGMKNGTFPIDWLPIGERDHLVDSVDLDNFLKNIKVEAGTAYLPPRAVKKILKRR